MSYKKAIENHSDAGSWYEHSRQWLCDNFRDPDLFAGLLAATSPRKQVKANYKLALKIYRRFMAGKDIDYSEILPAAKQNVQNVLAGNDLSGDKVRAFYANLTGDYQQVTIDIWMLRFFKFDGWITPNRYKAFAKRIKTQAKKLGKTPAALQAIIWTFVRSEHGLKHVDFVTVATDNQKLLF